MLDEDHVCNHIVIPTKIKQRLKQKTWMFQLSFLKGGLNRLLQHRVESDKFHSKQSHEKHKYSPIAQQRRYVNIIKAGKSISMLRTTRGNQKKKSVFPRQQFCFARKINKRRKKKFINWEMPKNVFSNVNMRRKAINAAWSLIYTQNEKCIVLLSRSKIF